MHGMAGFLDLFSLQMKRIVLLYLKLKENLNEMRKNDFPHLMQSIYWNAFFYIKGFYVSNKSVVFIAIHYASLCKNL